MEKPFHCLNVPLTLHLNDKHLSNSTSTGQDFVVPEGRTLLLPCGRAPKPKQRWFHRRYGGGRREPIFTRYRNGTVKAERTGSRLSFQNDALQIQDLRPEDGGEYHCNGELQGRVTVLPGGLLLGLRRYALSWFDSLMIFWVLHLI